MKAYWDTSAKRKPAGLPGAIGHHQLKAPTRQGGESFTQRVRSCDTSNPHQSDRARRYGQGANVVVLEDDVAKVFPNSQVVNDSLRALAGILKRQRDALAAK